MRPKGHHRPVHYNKSIIKYLLTTLGVIALLFLSVSYNYLLFHNIAETLSIIIAVSVFILVWNSRSFTENDYFMFIGISFLFVAIVDFIHTLSYFGRVFPTTGETCPLSYGLSPGICRRHLF
jgi:hypothetical protein